MNKLHSIIAKVVAHVIATPDASVLVAMSKHSPLPNVASAIFVEEMRRPWVKELGVAISVDRQTVDSTRVKLELIVSALDKPQHEADVIFQRVVQDHEVRGYEPSFVAYDELVPSDAIRICLASAGRRRDGEARAVGFSAET